tara:strand:- start:255 stop:500 length:246 start_codon:yes stop_codon:yes gene_type:complete
MGGLAPKTLKKLKGDRLTFPSLSTVLAKQIGLGATAPNKYPCNFGMASSLGSILNIATKIAESHWAEKFISTIILTDFHYI